MRRRTVLQYALLIGFFLVPLLFLNFGPKYVPLSVELYISLLVISILTGVPAAIFFVLALASNLRRTGRSVGAEYMQREHRLTAWAALFTSLTITGALATNFTPVAPVYAALVLAYALWALPASSRHLEFRSTIVAKCSPEEAFAFVTDPRNVSRFLPEVEVAGPVDDPIHVGSTIRYRVRIGRAAIEGDETVTDIEPNRRFATSAGPGGLAVYSFTPVDGGTEIAYSSIMSMSFSFAVLGGVVTRRQARQTLIARREEALRKIKEILEAPAAVSV